MAPYDEKVKQFLDKYKDQFQTTLLSSHGGGGGGTTANKDFAGTPMSKEQFALERLKLESLAQENRDKLVHPDTMQTIMGNRAIPATGGRPRPENPEAGIWKSPVGRGALGMALGAAATPVSAFADVANKGINLANEGLGYTTGYKFPGEMRTDLTEQAANTMRGGWGDVASGLGLVPAGGGGERPIEMRKNPTTGTYEPSGMFDPSRTREQFNMTAPGPGGGAPIPANQPAGATYFQYTRPDGSVGFTDREEGIPTGARAVEKKFEDTGAGMYGGFPSASAVSGSAVSGSPVPMTPAGTPKFEIPYEMQSQLNEIQKVLMKPTERPMGYTAQGWQPIGKEGGYSKYRLQEMGDFARTLGGLVSTGAGYQAKMAEIGAEAPGRAALADYYNRKAGVDERALPWENFARYGAGVHALRQSEQGPVLGPGYSMKIGDQWITAPEKKEPIHPLVGKVMAESYNTDAAGQKTGFNEPEFRARLRSLWGAGLLPKGEVNAEYLAMPKADWIANAKAVAKANKQKFADDYYNTQYGEYVKRFM